MKTIARIQPQECGVYRLPVKIFSKKSFFDGLFRHYFRTRVNVLLLNTLLFSVKQMPPKSRKRKKGSLNLERAREQIGQQRHKTKRRDIEPETVADLLNLSHEAKDTDNEEEDPSFELDSSIKSDTHHLLDTFCEEWVAQLSREGRISLGIFIQYQLSTVLQKGETESAELVALM